MKVEIVFWFLVNEGFGEWSFRPRDTNFETNQEKISITFPPIIYKPKIPKNLLKYLPFVRKVTISGGNNRKLQIFATREISLGADRDSQQKPI